MKIEITDREHWLARVDAAINAIMARRAEEDSKYEREWRERQNRRAATWWGRLLGFKPVTDNDRPDPVDDSLFLKYPSIYAWGDLDHLKKIRQALTEEGTGVIYLDAEDLRAVS